MLDGVGYLHDVGPFLLAVVQATVKDKKPVGDLAIPGRHTTGVVLVDQTLRFAKKKKGALYVAEFGFRYGYGYCSHGWFLSSLCAPQLAAVKWLTLRFRGS